MAKIEERNLNVLLHDLEWFRRGIEDALNSIYDSEDIAKARIKIESILKDVLEREQVVCHKVLEI